MNRIPRVNGTAAEMCPCGAAVTLRRSSKGHQSWAIYDPQDLPEIVVFDIVEMIMRAEVAVAAFTPTITCYCGRTYRALDHRPWIALEER